MKHVNSFRTTLYERELLFEVFSPSSLLRTELLTFFSCLFKVRGNLNIVVLVVHTHLIYPVMYKIIKQ